MPTYMDVSDDLAEELQSASPGEQLLSETELAQKYGVARLTIRAAIQELERRHLVRKIHGRGTFVTRRIPLLLEPENVWTFASAAAAHGYDSRTTNDRVTVRPSTAGEAKQLGISARTQVMQVERRRWLENEVVGALTSILPARLVPDLAQHIGAEGSLNRALVNHFQLHPRRVWCRAEIVPASHEIAARLAMSGHPDVIHIEGRFISTRLDRPTELEEGWMRADIFTLVVEMGDFR